MKKVGFILICLFFSSTALLEAQPGDCKLKPPQNVVHFGRGMIEDVNIHDLPNYFRVALKDQPDEVLQWIIENSEYHEYEEGTCVRKLGDPQNELYFILEGSLNFFMDVNGRQVYYFTFANDVATGGVSGLLPYSRMKTSPGYAYAVDTLRAIMMHKDHFHELEHRSPELIQRLVGYMTERARLFATVQLQHEKVSALGKLSAGIAHYYYLSQACSLAV